MDRTEKEVNIFQIGWYDLLVITAANHPHFIVVNIALSTVYAHD